MSIKRTDSDEQVLHRGEVEFIIARIDRHSPTDGRRANQKRGRGELEERYKEGLLPYREELFAGQALDED